MKSIWNKSVFLKNLDLFKIRFPSLYNLFEDIIKKLSSLDFENETEMKNAFPFWEISFSKNGFPVAEENGLKLHSFYNPERESENLLSNVNDQTESIVFEGFGLGYAVVLASKKFSDKRIVVLESEPLHFFASLSVLDWEKVFKVRKLVLAISCPPEESIKLVNQNSILKSVFVSVPSQINHDKKYFETIQTLVQRNKRKEEINLATTKKFGFRWNKNCLLNAENAFFCDDAGIFKDSAENIPFLILAAGPSLNEILPFLNDISKKCVTIAVDTSLRALQSVGFQSDFIILTDPQYFAYRHLTGIKAEKSILITTQDVYPSVFRFKCKKIVCSQSQMPIGRFFERFCGKKADLGSGGSVASCAWNFAKLCGAKKIFLSGLDLSFPEKQTHIKGSTFEQSYHFSSKKTDSAETRNTKSLFSGNPIFAESYNGKKIITDSKMKMFAWWFESRIAECPENETFTLNPNGLKIPGVKLSSVQDLLNCKDISSEKKTFFENSERNSRTKQELLDLKGNFSKAENLLKEKLSGIDIKDFCKVEEALAL